MNSKVADVIAHRLLHELLRELKINAQRTVRVEANNAVGQIRLWHAMNYLRNRIERGTYEPATTRE